MNNPKKNNATMKKFIVKLKSDNSVLGIFDTKIDASNERLYGLIRKYDGKRMKRVRPGSYMPDNDKDKEENETLR